MSKFFLQILRIMYSKSRFDPEVENMEAKSDWMQRNFGNVWENVEIEEWEFVGSSIKKFLENLFSICKSIVHFDLEVFRELRNDMSRDEYLWAVVKSLSLQDLNHLEELRGSSTLSIVNHNVAMYDQGTVQKVIRHTVPKQGASIEFVIRFIRDFLRIRPKVMKHVR
eukprot:TRINITY_DN16641_c0_g1_i13.p1 TRINITY_DN16641_c0_g1~~TRINITY_DN16641_c0_g1_i13.p1  ORF type:complete len:167 (+),score=38.93 TRINITY_DN16641_c0_g1_i13:216-716(+)